ncbi:protein argonaute 10-like [Arachis duranensis]|uniref:Protein argonaute 10-like n=1 Tax=Arachis duranensis TaxID=130453 RepID=A0A9C6TCF0_ARADU|nr:protein argonaute 10-like [Arachis duranensis]
MASAAFIEPLPVVEYAAQLLGKDLLSRQLSDADRIKACKIVEKQHYTKRLNEKQITALVKVTCQRPRDLENDILQKQDVPDLPVTSSENLLP